MIAFNYRVIKSGSSDGLSRVPVGRCERVGFGCALATAQVNLGVGRECDGDISGGLGVEDEGEVIGCAAFGSCKGGFAQGETGGVVVGGGDGDGLAGDGGVGCVAGAGVDGDGGGAGLVAVNEIIVYAGEGDGLGSVPVAIGEGEAGGAGGGFGGVAAANR